LAAACCALALALVACDHDSKGHEDAAKRRGRPFDHGLVSITFDDGWLGQLTFASPRLAERGWQGTFYLVPSWFGGEKKGEKLVTVEQAQQLIVAGHEIGNHTESHPTLTRLKPPEIQQEMQLGQTHLSEQLGIARDSIVSFATPGGAFNKHVLKSARKLFGSHRTGKAQLNTPDTDPHVLGAYLLQHDNRGSRDLGWIEQLLQRTADERGWLILVFHDIVDGPAVRGSDEPLEVFEQILDQIEGSGLEVVTVAEGVEAIHAANERAD